MPLFLAFAVRDPELFGPVNPAIEAILGRFTRGNVQHTTYKALAEQGDQDSLRRGA